MIERRRVERFDLNLQTFVSVEAQLAGGEPVVLNTRDISTNGAFVLTGQPLAAGTKVNLDMILKLDDSPKQGGKKAIVRVTGTVLRIDDYGMAVGFDADSKILPFVNG